MEESLCQQEVQCLIYLGCIRGQGKEPEPVVLGREERARAAHHVRHLARDRHAFHRSPRMVATFRHPSHGHMGSRDFQSTGTIIGKAPAEQCHQALTYTVHWACTEPRQPISLAASGHRRQTALSPPSKSVMSMGIVRKSHPPKLFPSSPDGIRQNPQPKGHKQPLLYRLSGDGTYKTFLRIVTKWISQQRQIESKENGSGANRATKRSTARISREVYG